MDESKVKRKPSFGGPGSKWKLVKALKEKKEEAKSEEKEKKVSYFISILVLD